MQREVFGQFEGLGQEVMAVAVSLIRLPLLELREFLYLDMEEKEQA